MWMTTLIIVNTVLISIIWISGDNDFKYWKLPLYLLLTLGFTGPLCYCAAVTAASLHEVWWMGIPLLLFFTGFYCLCIKGARVFFAKNPQIELSLWIELIIFLASVTIFSPAMD